MFCLSAEDPQEGTVGQDEAELVQCIEDEFGISISEDEALRARTAGAVYRLVLRKLEQTSSLLSARALYVTRKALAEALGVPRRSIGPGTRLDHLLPPATRVEQWKQIVERAGLRFPRLSHSRQLKDLVMLASMAISSVTMFALWWALYALDWIRGAIGMLLFTVPAALGWVLLVSRTDKDLLRSTERWARVLPFDTVGELAMAVLAMNLGAFQSGPGKVQPPSSEMVWDRITELIQQKGRVKQTEIALQTVIRTC
jgi:hypothetical protein